MPLQDHFHNELARRRWKGVHTTWIVALVEQLNGGLLPKHFECEPTMPFGAQVELDVATFQTKWDSDTEGGLAVMTEPTVSAAVTFEEADLPSISIYNNQSEGERLVAVIELVSPANKDRPETRRAFALKCAGLLSVGVSVMVIDVVTTRRANMHTEIVKLFSEDTSLAWSSETHLAALSYFAPRTETTSRLDVWAKPLALEARLPMLPLWLAPNLAVPLELESSYQKMCMTLRLA